MADQKKPLFSRDTIVGTFVFIVFIGLVLFTIVLSGTSLFGKRGEKLFVEFERVGGLRRHDSVIVRGMPVGQVKALDLRETGVLVTVDLTVPVVIREGYAIRAESTSLLGGMQLVINAGTGAPVGHSMQKPLKGEPPENVMENANDLITELRASLNEGGIRTNVEAIVSDIRFVTDTLKAGEGTLGHLLSADDSLYLDLAASISNLNVLSERLARGEGTIGKLLSDDDTPYVQITNFVCNLDAIGTRLNSGEGTLGKLLSSDDAIFQDLKDAMASLKSVSARLENGEGAIGRLLSPDDPLATDLADTVHNLKVITARLENGEGLLGQLMRDDGAATTEVNGLIKDGRDFIDDMRETSPVSTFSSIFFGAL